ncbi:MAG: hypothetical protein QOE03_1917 [Micromonosporaceae bacterium]|jgi:PAS domain S-box-containing protein|nr:hypothetical protein [Micromonosporaceae bacterium]
MALAHPSAAVGLDHGGVVAPGLVADRRLLAWWTGFVPVAGLATIGLGATVLVGWAAGLVVLTCVVPGTPSMRPNTAVCLVLLGACLLVGFPASAVSAGRRGAAAGCASIVAIVGLFTLAEYAVGVDLGLDRVLFAGAVGVHPGSTSHPGRMAMNTATAVVLLAGAQVLLLVRARSRNVRVGQAMCLGSAGLGLLGLYGYVLQVPGLQQFLGLTGIPVPTAVGVIVVSVATFFTCPVDGLARLLTARGPSAMLTRRMLATTLLVPAAIGWVGLRAQGDGWFGTQLDVLLVTFSNVTVFAAVSVVVGARAARLEAARDHAVACELSARKRADAGQRAMQLHLRTLAAIVESSDDAIIGETLDGTITSWNPGAERMYGHAAADAVGANISIIAGPAGIAELSDVLAKIAAGQRVDHYETQRTHKDGALVDVSVTVSPIQDDNGTVVGASAVARDVRARKRAEARQKTIDERTRLAQRLQSVGQLAGGVAHDFNNLLAVILNFTAFVTEQTADDEAVQADLAQVRAAVERAAGLTNQLLLFTRGETTRPELLDVNAAIAEAHAMLARTIGESIELVAVPSSDPLMIYADGGQIQQVLINLAVNARDAMPDGGTLVLAGTITELDEHHVDLQPALPAGRYVRLLVSDTGVGMSRDVVAHIFEPFYTTKPTGQGTGLGLATVYAIVTEAGGSLNVYSEPNLGTTFRAYFPVADQPSAGVTTAPDAVQPPRGNGETILVVDDEDAIRQVVFRILDHGGYHVLSARGGREALTTAADHRFQLLLTDAIMPDMSGRRLAELVRRQHPRLPVLYMSGYSDGLRGTQFIVDEEIGFIEKPFTAHGLLQRVHDLLVHRDTDAPAANGH